MKSKTRFVSPLTRRYIHQLIGSLTSGHTYRRLFSSFDKLQRALLLLTPADLLQVGALLGFTATCLLPELPSLQIIGGIGFASIICAWRLKLLRQGLIGAFLAFTFAVVQFDRFSQLSFPQVLESRSLQIEGAVVGLPQENELRQRFDFRIKSITTNAGNQHSPGDNLHLDKFSGQLIRLSCYRCKLEINAGQSWSFTVRVKRPHGYASWGAFDYERYLFRERIIALGYVREKEPYQLLGDADSGVDVWRSKIKEQLDDVLSIPGAGAGIIAALTLGDKSLLSSDQKDIFQAVGVSHLMAISGLHVGLVFVASMLLLKYLLWPVVGLFNFVARQTLVLIPGLIAATVYAALSGFAVSTQRALIMLAVYVLCRLFARDLSLLRVLMLAAVLILFYDPFSILDAGFWLSCCAVFIIALLNLRHRNIVLWRLQPALWLGMVPLSTILFGQVSLISPLVNLVAVPLFCLVLIPFTLGALLLHQAGGVAIALPALQVLELLYSSVFSLFAWCADLPVALFYPPTIELWKWAVLVGLILVSLLKPRVSILALFMLILWMWPVREPMTPDAYKVTLLDVGQGLSIVVEANNYVLVYDTGPAFGSGFSAAKAVLLPYLRSRGISEIDQLIISHADNDHIGGLKDLRRNIRINSILTSRPDRISNSRQCFSGQSWKISKVKFQILGPDDGTPDGSNNRSCVLAIDNEHYRTLITGDIERQVERYMVQNSQKILSSDFVLVPHQGSKTSSTAEFLDAVRPKLALIAAGYKNHYGHPHPEVITRYREREIQLLSTVELGAVQLNVKADDWNSAAYRTQFPRFWRK